MFNMMKADFYLLRRTRGFWLAESIFIAVIVESVVSQTTGSFSITPIDQRIVQTGPDFLWTGTGAVYAMSTMASWINYILLPLLIIVIGQDFLKEAYKNSLTVGSSRPAYFCSKYVVFLSITMLHLITFYVLTFCLATVLNGVGAGFSSTFIKEVCQIILLQFLFLVQIINLAILSLYLTSNGVIAVLTGFLVPLFLAALSFFLAKFEAISWFNFQMNLDQALSLIQTPHQLPKLILTALATISLTIFATLLIFKRREL